jgi:endoglucanase
MALTSMIAGPRMTSRPPDGTAGYCRSVVAHFIRGLAATLIALLLYFVWALPANAADTPDWRRGINHGDYLAYPQSSEWPIFRGPRSATNDQELQALARAGFDFIRLAVEPTPFLDLAPDRVALIERRLVSFVERANASGLKVMVSGWARHEATPRWRAPDILASADNPELKTYLGFLERIMRLLAHIPKSRWALEPMNEPQAKCWRDDGPDWSTLQPKIFKHLRAIAPDLTIVITTGCWSKQAGLVHLDMAKFDNRTLVDLHYYDPWRFTHQGATWNADWIKSLAGLSFPPARTDRQGAVDASARLFTARNATGGAAAFTETLREIDSYLKENHGPERIREDMDRIAAWAKTQGVDPKRIVIGEFGVLLPQAKEKARDDGSRTRWLETVRLAFEQAGFGWANYAYHAEFGLVRDENRIELDPDVLQALGLKVERRPARP